MQMMEWGRVRGSRSKSGNNYRGKTTSARRLRLNTEEAFDFCREEKHQRKEGGKKDALPSRAGRVRGTVWRP